MGRSQVRGSAGEALAAAYLELAGFSIEARNVRVGGVEVDIVANDGESWAVVEVKFRARSDYGGAALAVDRMKRDRLRRAALALEREARLPVRIDVIAIESHGEGATIRHFRNAVVEGD